MAGGIFQTDKELAEIRESLNRGRPFGEGTWQTRTAEQLDLKHTFRQRGRPKKQVKDGKK